MKKLLNKEIVEQAIACIQAADDKPTIERIRKITGGSPKTIIAIKRLIDDNEHDNALSSNDIKALIDTRIKQQFEQLKSELLDMIKKNDFDVNNSTPDLVQENQVLHQQIKSIKTENIELSKQLEKQGGLIQKLTTDKNQLVLKNKNKFEIIERLQADIKRLEEAKEVSEARSKEAEQARLEAVKKIEKIASENTELRSNLEAISATETEPNSSIIDTTEFEQNDSKIEPEIKFTLDEAHERFLELRKEFPGKKQKEYLRILDSEGYTNSVGKSVGAYNLNRWKNTDKTAAKVGQK